MHRPLPTSGRIEIGGKEVVCFECEVSPIKNTFWISQDGRFVRAKQGNLVIEATGKHHKDPQKLQAYFAQGVSYGQLENFFEAIVLINKAIEMEPRNGLYYYGRARVYLLADDKEKAIENFKKAAELDDEDAQIYINTIAKTQ